MMLRINYSICVDRMKFVKDIIFYFVIKIQLNFFLVLVFLKCVLECRQIEFDMNLSQILIWYEIHMNYLDNMRLPPKILN